ncbi:hypothetical protein BC936DRAFT_148353 [Jimgerdemannia flammicorona]|uniref:Uncharacterized protein n=1 Tax=Jimgerdemannia flammicorona TaxID=994334 RepID=A0A433DN59_9FUNG|nr:hypothetical protein BC936DRAFT_148353 [Jimgerdemannia flammicorona]
MTMLPSGFRNNKRRHFLPAAGCLCTLMRHPILVLIVYSHCCRITFPHRRSSSRIHSAYILTYATSTPLTHSHDIC